MLRKEGKEMNHIAFDTDRKNYGITLAEIAEEIGISTSTLDRWLKDPDREKEEKILDAVERLKALKD